ncbi:peptidase M10A and M12B matrixin and adamalysin [Fluviicola taffensis]|uniref:Peptidase M10A and M12B matrixin and adamalysin n=1 Tax=Fluviicola taffensis (strain DSM 16823 / NCIMB 13979 / RW262) TaxID=755732 RepID=F2IFW8_FLUTR|nr:peptidase M10A and M12B matrixin and adamalysin [Fluviicola taffensis]AEA43589.1 peptidase M10A and M12B matrixin and adamalysin [Fluviicola taffensis DSM 16823]
MKRTLTILFSLFLFVLNAQQDSSNLSPNGIFDKVFDMNGRQYQLSDLQVGSIPKNAQLAPALLCSSGYFDLYFEQGSGMEGSSQTEIDRRNVICQVFSDLSQFIVPANSNVHVNILVRNINQELPGYDPLTNPFPAAISNVLGLASGFYVVPSNASATKGIIDNEIWKTINSGVDSYTGVASPLISTVPNGAMFYHGMVGFNFDNIGNPWNILLNQAPSSSSYFDLYSVALHEITHALGFASLIDANGDSKFNTGYEYYSRYDLFLKTAGNQSLITNTGACSLYNYSFNPALNPTVMTPASFDCATHIKFAGTVNKSVYSPSTFQPPSSLSHMEDVCHHTVNPYLDDEYYVMSNGQNGGSMKRYLKPEERAVLCDIGYQVNTTYGITSNLNYFNYNVGVCPGLQIAGVNDGITSGGLYQHVVSPGGSLTISTILQNDVNASSFECLENIYGNGTLTAISSTSFTYTAATPGVVLLRYIPVSGTGVRGNITYVLIYVSAGNCTPTVCSMLNNGNFEGAGQCGQLEVPASNGISINCWSPAVLTPDLFKRNCTSTFNNNFSIPATYYNSPGAESWNGSPNNHFMGFAGLSNGFEAAQSLLNIPLVQNQTYTLSFRAKVAYNAMNQMPPLGTNGQITFGAALSTIAWPGANSVLPSIPGSVYQLGTPIIINNTANNNWDYYSQTFTYTGSGNLSNFFIANTSLLGTSGNTYGLYIYMDDISLVAANPTIVMDLPNAMCSNQSISDLSPYAPLPNGSFSGNGVQYSGGVYSFNAAVAGIGMHTIVYTYTDNNGCSQTISDIIEVGPIITVSAINNFICSGQQVSITASGADTYTWSPATGLSTTTGPVVIASPTASTTYTITGTNSLGCTASKLVHVFITPPTATISGTTSVCQNSGSPSIALTASFGTAPYTFVYTINGGANQTITTTYGNGIGIPVPTNTSGTFTYNLVSVTSATGCSQILSGSATVTIKPLPTATISTVPTVCQGAPSPTITFTGLNGTAPYTFYYTTNGVNQSIGSGSGNVATVLVPTSATGTFTYTLTSVNSAMGCSKSQSGTAAITVSPCPDCGTGTLISGTVTTSPTANTTLRVASNTTISGNVTFTGNNVKIQPGVTITVASTATLNITGSHFYGCENMWQGIVVQPGGKVNMQPYIVSSTVTKTPLIEDAVIGVDFLPVTTQQSVILLQVNNATFNKNATAIRVQGYPFANVASMFSVKNSLFTCRTIYNTSASTWPLTTTVKALNGSTDPYVNPYITTTYPITTMKVPQNSTFSDKGIQLVNVGTVFNSMNIGSTVAAEYNVFDNLKVALHCSNANVKVENTAVQFPQIITSAMYSSQSLPNIGTGIFATATSGYLGKVDVAGTTSLPNKFYGLSRVLHVVNYQNVQFNYNTIRSTRTNNYPVQGYYNGNMGLYLSLEQFQTVGVVYNTIYNTNTGVFVSVNNGINPCVGASIAVSNNLFQKNLGTNNGSFGTSAIHLENNSALDVFAGSIYSISNTITGSLRGITVNNWLKTSITTNENTLTLGINPNAFVGASSYGIAYNNCTAGNGMNQIYGNNVIGFSQAYENYKGIQFTQSMGNNISCNGTRDTHTGLYFNGTCSQTKTYKTTMQNHRYGFVLDNSAIIGQQGTTTTPTDNTWVGTTWSPTGTTNGNFKNACLNGSNTNNSKMYVRNSSSCNPNGSTFTSGLGSWSYTASISPITLFYVSNPPLETACVTSLPPEEGLMAGTNGSEEGIASETASAEESAASWLEESAELVESVIDSDHQVVMKNQLYRLSEEESGTLSSAQPELDALIETESQTNIGTLWEVEKSLSVGDLAEAAAINNSVNPENRLEESYQLLYEADLHYRNEVFNTSDSLVLVDLAQGCPAQQGGSVFQAQALYNHVYHTATIFTPDCQTSSAKSMQQTASADHPDDENVLYKLYPVPNNGIFKLQGSLLAGDQLQIMQLDGKLLLAQTIMQDEETMDLATHLSSGTYVVVLKNSEGQVKYRNRIVVLQ